MDLATTIGDHADRVGVLAAFAVVSCIAAGLLKTIALAGDEPLLEVVTAPGTVGAVAGLVASTWLFAPPTATVAAAVLSVESRS